ncbi:Uncharacterised protein [Vibrio cholerae]|nr:Uncharacterised protein [Vibrio cholerae]
MGRLINGCADFNAEHLTLLDDAWERFTLHSYQRHIALKSNTTYCVSCGTAFN